MNLEAIELRFINIFILVYFVDNNSRKHNRMKIRFDNSNGLFNISNNIQAKIYIY